MSKYRNKNQKLKRKRTRNVKKTNVFLRRNEPPPNLFNTENSVLEGWFLIFQGFLFSIMAITILLATFHSTPLGTTIAALVLFSIAGAVFFGGIRRLRKKSSKGKPNR